MDRETIYLLWAAASTSYLITRWVTDRVSRRILDRAFKEDPGHTIVIEDPAVLDQIHKALDIPGNIGKYRLWAVISEHYPQTKLGAWSLGGTCSRVILTKYKD